SHRRGAHRSRYRRWSVPSVLPRGHDRDPIDDDKPPRARGRTFATIQPVTCPLWDTVWDMAPGMVPDTAPEILPTSPTTFLTGCGRHPMRWRYPGSKAARGSM